MTLGTQESRPAGILDIAGRLPQVPRPPLVLVADDQEWSARAFESVLHPNGFAVLRSQSAHHALEQVRTVSPDMVLLKSDLPDIPGPALCRILRGSPGIGPATPLFITYAGPIRREHRMEALRAGAWDVVTLPLDAEELLLRLGVFVRAKLEADRAREESLVDLGTGVYSVQGLLRRVREMGLQAMRSPAPVGCAVISPEEPWQELAAEPPGTQRLREGMIARMVALVTRHGRRSDVIGRLSETEFAVVAPQTGPGGVLLLARRLLAAARQDEAESEGPPLRLRIGCYAVDDFSGASLDPVELLVRATMALRRAQRDAASPAVCFFEPAGVMG